MVEFDISELVPRFLLKDRNGRAMAAAIEAALKYFCKAVKDAVGCYRDVDVMPEWRLDEMAWEIGAEWYDATASIAVKRKQIRAAWDVMRMIGTKAGLMYAVESVYGEGFLREWFEYGGQPYHYRVYATDASESAQNNAEFLRIVRIVANVRSVMDDVVYYGAEGTATLHMDAEAYGASGGVVAAKAK